MCTFSSFDLWYMYNIVILSQHAVPGLPVLLRPHDGDLYLVILTIPFSAMQCACSIPFIYLAPNHWCYLFRIFFQCLHLSLSIFLQLFCVLFSSVASNTPFLSSQGWFRLCTHTVSLQSYRYYITDIYHILWYCRLVFLTSASIPP